MPALYDCSAGSSSECQRAENIAFDSDQRDGIAPEFRMMRLKEGLAGYGKSHFPDRPPCHSRVPGFIGRHAIVGQTAHIAKRQTEIHVPGDVEIRLEPRLVMRPGTFILR